jgi:hypothetical protein
MDRGLSRFVALLAVLLFVAFAPTPAAAQPPPADLMARLGAYAQRFETLRTHASYALEGRLESLDGSNHVDSVKEMKAHVDSDGHDVHLSILKYLEDGQDKTNEAKDKQREHAAEKAKEPPSAHKRETRMPFHPGEQPRYWFDIVETDPQNADRVRISFVPKIREDDTIEGSAWVDTRAGTVISAGFKFSKTPAFVDSIHVTVFFGEATPLGPAPSRIMVDARGGMLFVHKHYRGVATLSQIHLVP